MVRKRTYEALLRIAGKRREVFERCVLRDEAETVWEQSRNWWYAELERPEARLGLTASERNRLRAVYEKSARLRKSVARLDSALDSVGATSGRRLAAYSAVISPLNRYWVTGGIERGLMDLSENEVARFLSLGLDREALLLRRASDLAQQQWMAAVFDSVDEAEERRSQEMGATNATWSWDFLNAEREFSEANITDDWLS